MNENDPQHIYADIIDIPHHQSQRRRHMSLHDRAAQFAPFAALSGYDDMVREESRLTEKETDLSEYEAELLDRKLGIIIHMLNSGDVPEIKVTYFVPDKHKKGGSYQSVTGLVKGTDIPGGSLILYGSYDIEDRKTDPVIISFDKIRDINIMYADT